MTKRASFYIDGFNLYYGLKSKGWKKYYWLDLKELCKIVIKNKDEKLTGIKYFTARISSPPAKVKRQATYLDALVTLNEVEIIEGVYYSNPIICNSCGSPYCCICGKRYIKKEEKRSDVNIALNLICDAFDDKYDVAYLISGDSDLVPAVEKFRQYFRSKEIIILFPPNRVSKALKKVCNIHMKFFENTFRKSQFPDQLKSKAGHNITRPVEWY